MNKYFKYSVIVLFAVMMLSSTIVAFAESEGCTKQTFALYRPVNFNIIHDDAIVIDPKFTIPPGQQAINIQPSNTNEDTKRTNSGFVINGTGTYTIDFALTHAGTKQVTEDNPYGQRLIELFIQSAGEQREVVTSDYYTVPDYCKVYELIITEKPIIPTDEEFASIAYGVITPIIKGVEKAVLENNTTIERNTDRGGILTIIMLGLVAITVILNYSNRREKAQVLEEYNLVSQRLRNQEVQQTNDMNQFERKSKETLEHQREILKGFMEMFNISMEAKTHDLGHVINSLFTRINELGLEIPDYHLPDIIPENTDETFPEPCPCGYCDYTSRPIIIPKPIRKFDYLTAQLKEPVTAKSVTNLGDKLNQLFKKESVEVKKESIEEMHKRYDVMQKMYDAETNPDEQKRLSTALNDFNEQIKEEIRKNGY